jgi:hypothetical protein
MKAFLRRFFPITCWEVAMSMIECPGDCGMCSGEYCVRHGNGPCECDTMDRHYPDPPTKHGRCRWRTRHACSGSVLELYITG